MARGKTTVRGRAPLARDNQQWILDYLIQETGKVFHFQGDGRGRLPRSVRSHDMISKHLGLQAQRLEGLAKAEAAAGHPETALDFYFQATVLYGGPSTPSSRTTPRNAISMRAFAAVTTRSSPWRPTIWSISTSPGTARWCRAICISAPIGPPHR
jgi:hypothetical protein